MKQNDREQFDQENVFGIGEANATYAQYFIGESFLNPLTASNSGLFAANVTFAPGYRKLDYVA